MTQNLNEPSGASGGPVPWSEYDKDTLATGVGAIAELMGRLGNIKEQMFLSVMTYAFFLGRGIDPATVTEMPDEMYDELEFFLNETAKCRKECKLSHLLVSGLVTTIFGKDGTELFVGTAHAKELVARG